MNTDILEVARHLYKISGASDLFLRTCEELGHDGRALIPIIQQMEACKTSGKARVITQNGTVFSLERKLRGLQLDQYASIALKNVYRGLDFSTDASGAMSASLEVDAIPISIFANSTGYTRMSRSAFFLKVEGEILARRRMSMSDEDQNDFINSHNPHQIMVAPEVLFGRGAKACINYSVIDETSKLTAPKIKIDFDGSSWISAARPAGAIGMDEAVDAGEGADIPRVSTLYGEDGSNLLFKLTEECIDNLHETNNWVAAEFTQIVNTV